VIDIRSEKLLDTWDGVEQICDPARAGTFMQVTGHRYRWEFQLHDGEDQASMITPDALGRLLEPWTGRRDLDGLEIIRSAMGSPGGPPQGSFPRPGRRAQHRPAVPWPSRDHRSPRPREHGRRAAGRRQPRVTRPVPAAGCVLSWSCPFLGAKWEPRSAVGCGQKLSDAVTVAV
jgi:hypothetical protein